MSQRGSVLLGVMLLASAAVTVAGVVSLDARAAARELGDRNHVLCARYAALSGIVLGAAAHRRPQLVSTAVSSLDVGVVHRGPRWCVVVARARCKDAMRTIERTLPADTDCR